MSLAPWSSHAPVCDATERGSKTSAFNPTPLYIVDPAKVTRSGLQNAASIAGMVLTTECIVADLPEKKDAAPAGGGMGGGDFDY